MKTAALMIAEHGGLDRLREEPVRVPASDPWMRLAIEHVGLGPRGHPLVSVAHYFEANGDLVPDPDMTFEVTTAGDWLPVAIQHATGAYFEAAYRDDRGLVRVDPARERELRNFARLWSRNLLEQGYPERFRAARRANRAGGKT